MKRKSLENRIEETTYYTVLILDLDDFKPSARSLPEGFALVADNDAASYKNQQKRVLRKTFDDWQIPHEGRLKGWRKDSPVLVVHEGKIAGGVYLCERNEFNDETDAGQLHYAFMEPKYKGLGIYSVIFNEAVKKARGWGLQRLYLNSDRVALPEVYLRWGAKTWKTFPKKSLVAQSPFGRFLWPLKLCARRFVRFIIAFLSNDQ